MKKYIVGPAILVSAVTGVYAVCSNWLQPRPSPQQDLESRVAAQNKALSHMEAQCRQLIDMLPNGC